MAVSVLVMPVCSVFRDVEIVLYNFGLCRESVAEIEGRDAHESQKKL